MWGFPKTFENIRHSKTDGRAVTTRHYTTQKGWGGVTLQLYMTPDAIVDAVEKGLEKNVTILWPNMEAKILQWLRRFSSRLCGDLFMRLTSYWGARWKLR